MKRTILALFAGALSAATAFTANQQMHNYQSVACRLSNNNDGVKDNDSNNNNRRELLKSSAFALVAAASSFPLASKAADDPPPDTKTTDGEGVIMYKTRSGLKYIELEAGDPSYKTPRYGQLCIFSYKAYLKLPNAKEKAQFDDDEHYITKHGNGRIIPGLDEGLHTMKVGGLRRIIIPPKLGFVDSAMGPLPEYPWNRWKLNGLLKDMVTQQGGNLVYDVRLERVIDDEADQGYYEDEELSPQELAELQDKLTRGGQVPLTER
jgi:FKBP-type peptidyl-prolyl cis-trans isomerase